MKRAAFHINEVLKMMAKAKDDHATVSCIQPQARCILCPTFLFMNF